MENLKASGKFEKPFLKNNWRLLSLSALAGFVAGWLAILLIFIFTNRLFLADQPKGNLTDILEKKINNSTEGNYNYISAVGELASRVVSLGRQDNDKVTQLAPGNILSSGIPLTSDGWVVALKPAGNLNKLGIAWNRLFYPIEKTVTDPLTDLIFLKVSAQGLPLAPFGKADGLKVGDELISFDHQKTFSVSRLLNAHLGLPAGTIRSSELLDAFEQIQIVPPGVPVFNNRGEFVGLVKSNGLMIGADYIQEALGDILKNGKIGRPFLGVNYVDLSIIISTVNSANKPLLGALIKSGKDSVAVIKGSPAERAGLKEGDIVLAVDNFEMNENQTLAEVIAGFSPGTKVALNVLRDGKEKKIEVTLGSK